MEKKSIEDQRNKFLGKTLNVMVESGEHGLCVSDILVSFINNQMLQDERDMIIDLLKKED